MISIGTLAQKAVNALTGGPPLGKPLHPDKPVVVQVWVGGNFVYAPLEKMSVAMLSDEPVLLLEGTVQS